MYRVLPTLFNTDMVRAILDGRKKVTRRICKDGNDYSVPDMSFYDADKRTYAVHSFGDKEHKDKLSLVERTCPICPGDILYVRETWTLEEFYDDESLIKFRARGEKCLFYKKEGDLYHKLRKYAERYVWIPSLFMPKEAARIWLNVTDVRVERLQDMKLSDFLDEGVAIREESFNDPENAYWQARSAFKNIWDSTIKKSDLDMYGWDANPYTWVREFERCEKPDDLC